VGDEGETLIKLAERCEAATGPDRELDLAIARLFDVTVWLRNDDDTANYETTHWRYTASIDAALTLVPEGCGWVAGYGQVRSDEPLGGAQITRHAKFAGYDVANDVIAEAEAATPALALCAAALRARTTLSTMKAADHDNS
jgi:hypothetical protein